MAKLAPQEENKIKGLIKTQWNNMGFEVRYITQMLVSGDPDTRVGSKLYGQLDIELKHKVTGPKGTATGIRRLQQIRMQTMNEYQMPAVGMVYSEHHKLFFVTMALDEDVGELHPWQWVTTMVKDRVPDPHEVFFKARRYLEWSGYDSYKRLTV